VPHELADRPINLTIDVMKLERLSWVTCRNNRTQTHQPKRPEITLL